MALIRNLKNLFTGNTIYPVTKTRAVYDDDGRRLDSYLKQVHGSPESNILINTNFANPVNQRGENTMASTGNASVGKYWIDRWSAKSFSTACTYSVDTANQCIKLYYDKSSTTPSSINQIIEFPETYGGKTLTLSALMKYDFVGSAMAMQISYVLNGTTTSSEARISSAGEWEELKSSLYIPFGITELSVTLYAPYAYNTTSGNGYVKWVKLEVGEFNTPYAPRLYAEELDLCQRYYQRYDSNQNSGYLMIGSYYARTATLGYVRFPLIKEMRTNPTLSYSNLSHFIAIGDNNNRLSISAIAIDQGTSKSVGIRLSSTYTINKDYELWLGTANGGAVVGSYIAFDAEL